jgi:protein SCO1/2
MSPRTRRLALPLVILLVGLAALATAGYLSFMPSGRIALPTAQIGGPFTLVSQDGKPASDRDYLGAPHLVFFGFTHCPDICPTKLFEMSEMFRAMGERGDKVRALFITVDPERDTPDVMKSYLSSFDPRIVGLTGSNEAIAKAVKEYRAYSKKVPLKDGDYTMEHTALVYLMDRDGQFVGSFNLEKPPAEAAQDLIKRL